MYFSISIWDPFKIEAPAHSLYHEAAKTQRVAKFLVAAWRPCTPISSCHGRLGVMTVSAMTQV